MRSVEAFLHIRLQPARIELTTPLGSSNSGSVPVVLPSVLLDQLLGGFELQSVVLARLLSESALRLA